MPNYRWLGASVLTSLLGCGGTFAEVADGGPDGADGSASDAAAPGADAAPPGSDAATDGGSPDTGAPDTGCATGSVTFEVTAAPSATNAYCLGAPATCSGQWVAIRPAGTNAPLTISAQCEATCGSCEPVACPAICAVPSRLGTTGARTTWDGTYYDTGTCGAAALLCVTPVCAAPGNYIARFCGYPEAADASTLGCTGSSTPTCTETMFVWPPPGGSSVVQGVLGP